MSLKSKRTAAAYSAAAGLFLLALTFSLTPALGDLPEMSLFPQTPDQAPAAPVSEEQLDSVPPAEDLPPEAADGMNLDIGRLDRTGRAPGGDRGAAPSNRPLPPPGQRPTQRLNIQLNVPRDRMPMPELETLPLPEGVELGENDVLAKSALTEIPKGEGYEATVSANTQGKLILLGRQKYGENGEALFDDDGNPVMIPMHRGMQVEEGEILGVQFNQAAHARRTAAERELEVAKKEAGKQLEVEVAEASKNVALMEYKRAVNANKRVPNSVSEDEVWQKRFEWYAERPGRRHLQEQGGMAP